MVDDLLPASIATPRERYSAAYADRPVLRGHSILGDGASKTPEDPTYGGGGSGSRNGAGHLARGRPPSGMTNAPRFRRPTAFNLQSSTFQLNTITPIGGLRFRPLHPTIGENSATGRGRDEAGWRSGRSVTR